MKIRSFFSRRFGALAALLELHTMTIQYPGSGLWKIQRIFLVCMTSQGTPFEKVLLRNQRSVSGLHNAFQGQKQFKDVLCDVGKRLAESNVLHFGI